MSIIPVRTITVHIGEPHPLSNTTLMRAKKFLHVAAQLFLESGFEIQMLGVSTRPLFLDHGHARESEITSYANTLQMRCEDHGIKHLSLGPILADNPRIPVERVNLLPEILAPNSALYVSVQIASNTYGISIEGVKSVARVINEIDKVADISKSDSDKMQIASEYLIAAFNREGRIISNLALRLAREYNVPFDGLDLSPMPNGTESIAKAVEAVGIAFFGDPGTVTVLSTITTALKKTSLKTCGFNSIFLPVHEDELIASRVASGQIDVSHLMLYSSVCDGALDAIPIAMDTPDARIEAILLDSATVATV